MNELPSD